MQCNIHRMTKRFMLVSKFNPIIQHLNDNNVHHHWFFMFMFDMSNFSAGRQSGELKSQLVPWHRRSTHSQDISCFLTFEFQWLNWYLIFKMNIWLILELFDGRWGILINSWVIRRPMRITCYARWSVGIMLKVVRRVVLKFKNHILFGSLDMCSTPISVIVYSQESYFLSCKNGFGVVVIVVVIVVEKYISSR